MGSIIRAPTLLLFLINYLVSFRHLSSSALFSCSNSDIGYLIFGNGALGHSKVGAYCKLTRGSLTERVAIEFP